MDLEWPQYLASLPQEGNFLRKVRSGNLDKMLCKNLKPIAMQEYAIFVIDRPQLILYFPTSPEFSTM